MWGGGYDWSYLHSYHVDDHDRIRLRIFHYFLWNHWMMSCYCRDYVVAVLVALVIHLVSYVLSLLSTKDEVCIQISCIPMGFHWIVIQIVFEELCVSSIRTNTATADWCTRSIVIIWGTIVAAILRTILILLGTVGWIIIFWATVQRTTLRINSSVSTLFTKQEIGKLDFFAEKHGWECDTYVLIFFGAISWIIIFRSRWIDRALSTLTILTCKSILMWSNES